jgi:hypothetical protein
LDPDQSTPLVICILEALADAIRRPPSEREVPLRVIRLLELLADARCYSPGGALIPQRSVTDPPMPSQDLEQIKREICHLPCSLSPDQDTRWVTCAPEALVEAIIRSIEIPLGVWTSLFTCNNTKSIQRFRY